MCALVTGAVMCSAGAGCGSSPAADATPRSEGESCGAGRVCEAGLFCDARVCYRPCRDDQGCSSVSHECLDGLCKPRSPGGCGDGVLEPGEDCDDQNYTGGDGCSASCELEPGWSCDEEPSVCTRESQGGDAYYTVSTSRSPPAGGSFSPTARSVLAGSITTFTITANSEYRVGSVTGCGGSLAGNVYTTGVIDAACTVTAGFVAVPPISAEVCQETDWGWEVSCVPEGQPYDQCIPTAGYADCSTGWVFGETKKLKYDLKQEALAFEINTSSDTSRSSLISITYTTMNPVTKVASISRLPGDFNSELDAACLKSGYEIITLRYTQGAPQSGYCKLEIDTRYYLNVKNATIDDPATPTCHTTAGCPFILQMY